MKGSLKPVVAIALGSIMATPIGCGGGGSPAGNRDGGTPDASGLSPLRTLASLTPAEKAALCDWMSDNSGGYGAEMMCADGSEVMNDPDQAACVADVPSCATTVGQFESCMTVVFAVPMCEQLGVLLTVSACERVRACLAPPN